jgi:hypothetical protein
MSPSLKPNRSAAAFAELDYRDIGESTAKAAEWRPDAAREADFL